MTKVRFPDHSKLQKKVLGGKQLSSKDREEIADILYRRPLELKILSSVNESYGILFEDYRNMWIEAKKRISNFEGSAKSLGYRLEELIKPHTDGKVIPEELFRDLQSFLESSGNKGIENE